MDGLPRACLARLVSPLTLLAGISFLSSLGIGVMLPLMPLFAVSLGASPVHLGLLMSAFAAANAAAQLIAGILADRWGARGFITGGMGTYALANALTATARIPPVLIGYRGVAGLGAGAGLVATRLYLARIFEPGRLAFANGVLSAAMSAGQVAGPAFGGLITAVGGLRLPFVIVALTSGLSSLASLALRPPPAPIHPPEAEEAPTAILRSRPLLTLLLAQLLLLMGFGGFITTYAPFAATVLHWSTLEVGVIFSILGAGSVLLGPPLSRLADRIGRRVVAAWACLPVSLFGLVLMLGLPRPILYGVALAAGAGVTTFSAAWYALLSLSAPGTRQGRTFGVISALSGLGTIVGAMAASAIWARAGLGPAVAFPGLPALAAGGVILLYPRERR